MKVKVRRNEIKRAQIAPGTHQMTPSEYRAALAVTGLTASVAAELFGVDELTSRRWASGEQPVPRAVALSLWLIASYGVSIAQARVLSESPRLPKSA